MNKDTDVLDSSFRNGHNTKTELVGGMSLTVAIIFIIGELAGSGVLALPNALGGTGWIGVLMIVVCCANAAYSGIHLGYCWLILEERWEEYRGKVRYPYPAIGERAVGRWMRNVVSVCVNFTLFGASVVYLLLCSQLIGSLLYDLAGIKFCYWILILGAILCPLTWLGTPSEFWPAAVGALSTTALACILMVISIGTDSQERHKDAVFPNPTFSQFFISFGTILFAFGGASTFPTFQNDMRDKKQFPKAAFIGFCGLLLVYLPVAICGYSVFGAKVNPNVVINMAPGAMRKTVEVLLACHFFFAFVIVFNPMAQEMEEKLKVPRNFGWRRCVYRSVLVALVIFAGVSIPRFGKILSLVGGSTVALMTFVFPPIFYMRLCDQSPLGPSQSRLSFSAPSVSTESFAWPIHRISLHKRVYLIEIIVIGVIGGAVATVSAIMDMTDPSAFTPPCYVNITAAEPSHDL